MAHEPTALTAPMKILAPVHRRAKILAAQEGISLIQLATDAVRKECDAIEERQAAQTKKGE